MHRRQLLYSGGAAAAVIASNYRPRQAQAQPNSSRSPSPHAAFAKSALTHLMVLAQNPKHNPFRSGELAAAYKAHAIALESAGHNAHATSRIRQSLRPGVGEGGINPDHIYGVFDKLERAKKVSFTTSVKNGVVDRVVGITKLTAGDFHDSMQTQSLLTMQKSLHGGMLTLQAHALNQARAYKPVSLPWHPQYGYQTANFEPGSLHLRRIQDSIEQSGDPSAGGSYEQNISVFANPDDWPMALDVIGSSSMLIDNQSIPPYTNPVDMTYWNPQNLLSGYHTLSGNPLSPCTVYLAVIAAAKIGQEIGKAMTHEQMDELLLELEATTTIVLTGPELLAILGIVAIIATLGATFC